jgi:hypothetical protein
MGGLSIVTVEAASHVLKKMRLEEHSLAELENELASVEHRVRITRDEIKRLGEVLVSLGVVLSDG